MFGCIANDDIKTNDQLWSLLWMNVRVPTIHMLSP